MQGGLPLRLLVRVMRQVVGGVRHLHSLGILHRDLRAANVLVASMDPVQVLVADLGVAHLLSAFAQGVTVRGGVGGAGAPGATITTVLTGDAAVGPLQCVCACAVFQAEGRVCEGA